jgi:succinoglycan biosynthesis transport protein ExoP
MDPLKMPPPQEARLHFLDYWRIIRIRKTVIIAVFLLVFITATIVTYLLPQSFSSSAQIRVDRDVSAISMEHQGMPNVYDAYFLQTEIKVIQSEVILGRVVEALNLNKQWGKKFNAGQDLKTSDTVRMLRPNIDLSPERNASMINILVYSDDPDEAARIANKVADVYQQYRLDKNRENMMAGIKALQDQLDLENNEMRRAQSNVDWLRQDLKVFDPDPASYTPSTTYSAEMVRQKRNELDIARNDELSLKTVLTKLRPLDKKQLRATIQTATAPDSELGTLLNELDIAEQKLIDLERDVTTNNFQYVTMKRQVGNLEQKIDDRIEGIMKGFETRLDVAQAKVQALNSELEEATKTDQEVASRSRPYYAAKQELSGKQRELEILQIKIAGEKTDLNIPKPTMVEITNPARVDPNPVRPKKMVNIIVGLVIGLVVGIGLAFFIEYLDTSVKTIDDVERTLQAPVLGVIPQNVGFLYDEGAESPHAEAYRVLRTNLLFSRKDEKLNSIAVVSAGAGEGKSTTIFNLATVFAQNGNRVVIVDSDLRRPTLHKMLRVTNSIGLTNYLLKQNTLEEVIQTSSLPTLDFMASGKLPSSSMGILSSTQMRDLISELKRRYDFVLFDSPPIMGVSDASILASEVDMTLQVIQYRRYPQPMNIRAKQMIEKVGGNLVGIVLNNINVSQDESYYYYSGYYQDYYQRSEEAVPSGGAESSERKA